MVFFEPKKQSFLVLRTDLAVSENRGTPKSSILIGFSIINHPFWGKTPLFLETPTYYGRLFFSVIASLTASCVPSKAVTL